MQATPLALSEAAEAFCPEGQRFDNSDESMIQPVRPGVGAVQVVDLENPSDNEETESDNGTLLLSTITLPAHTCIVQSAFYPSVIIKVTSGTIRILIENWPGSAVTPDALISTGGISASVDLALDGTTDVTEGDWVRITNGALVAFANQTDVPAVFDVAGIKPAPDPAGGDCSGTCRGRP